MAKYQFLRCAQNGVWEIRVKSPPLGKKFTSAGDIGAYCAKTDTV